MPAITHNRNEAAVVLSGPPITLQTDGTEHENTQHEQFRAACDGAAGAMFLGSVKFLLETVATMPALEACWHGTGSLHLFRSKVCVCVRQLLKTASFFVLPPSFPV